MVAPCVRDLVLRRLHELQQLVVVPCEFLSLHADSAEERLVEPEHIYDDVPEHREILAISCVLARDLSSSKSMSSVQCIASTPQCARIASSACSARRFRVPPQAVTSATSCCVRQRASRQTMPRRRWRAPNTIPSGRRLDAYAERKNGRGRWNVLESRLERIKTRHDHSDWPLVAGCWLLKHFQHIKKRFRGPEGEESVFNALAVRLRELWYTTHKRVSYP